MWPVSQLKLLESRNFGNTNSLKPYHSGACEVTDLRKNIAIFINTFQRSIAFRRWVHIPTTKTPYILQYRYDQDNNAERNAEKIHGVSVDKQCRVQHWFDRNRKLNYRRTKLTINYPTVTFSKKRKNRYIGSGRSKQCPIAFVLHIKMRKLFLVKPHFGSLDRFDHHMHAMQFSFTLPIYSFLLIASAFCTPSNFVYYHMLDVGLILW